MNSIFTSLSKLFAEELAYQKAQLFLWWPVFLALGIAVYFTLPVEPPLVLAAVGLLFAGALFVVVFSSGWREMALLFLLLVAGFFFAQLRTHHVYTPLLQRAAGPLLITADIDSIEFLEGARGVRLVFSELAFEDDARIERAPRRIRLTYRGKEDVSELAIGDRVRFLARLNAPSGPVLPGGFDFQRYLYFQGIGAVGFLFEAPEIVQRGQVSAWRSVVESLRYGINKRIHAAMDPEYAAIGGALTTGYRAGITDEDREALRAAGLAHLLAISGLHLGLFSGFVFFVVRLGMVAVPGFGLRFPVKKIAAVAAFAAAVFYMNIAGATVPTQRAMLMTGVVLLAIMLDRSPVSMRLVAFAAFVVLLVFPESLVGASFQLSFAAVAALIFVYELTRSFWRSLYSGAGALRRAGIYVLGVCFTSIIATAATAPFALYHFHQSALYGLLANVIAVPVMSFVIMPMALLGMLLMPSGFEFWPLHAMEAGISWVVDVAHWTEGLEHSVFRVSALPFASLPLFVGGALMVMFLRTGLRWTGVILILMAAVLLPRAQMPDILISGSMKLFAYADRGDLYVSTRRTERFSIAQWEEFFGLEEGLAQGWPREIAEGQALSCDDVACRLELKGRRISFLDHAEFAAAECGWGDLVIARDPVKSAACRDVLVVDKFDGYYRGSHAVYLGAGGIQIKSAESLRGQRPWNARTQD